MDMGRGYLFKGNAAQKYAGFTLDVAGRNGS